MYDAQSNRIQTINHDDFTSQQFFYDAQDRMIQTTSTAGTSTYSYDYMGNRVQQNQSGNVTNYLWDEGSRFREVVYEYDNIGDATNSYTLVNDMILAQTNATETLYLLPDRLGSTRAVTDASGTVTDTFDYTAFGELIGDSSSLATNYLFAGQQYDSSTDLYSMRARYYDAGVRRFTVRDTLAYKTALEFISIYHRKNVPKCIMRGRSMFQF